jgi:hypothetical protein
MKVIPETHRAHVISYGRFYQEEFEDAKGVIRIRISKKNRQHNGQKKKVQKDKQRSTKHNRGYFTFCNHHM